MTDHLLTALRRASGLPSGGIRVSPRPPLPYQNNRLYDAWAGNLHLIVKQFQQPGIEQASAQRAARALEVLAALDIAPRLAFYDPAHGPLVVCHFLEGEMWHRRKPSATELEQLAETWLRIHSVPVDWLSHGSERPLDEVQADFRRPDGRLGLVDWEDS